MKIRLLEPLGVSPEIIDELARKFSEQHHDFVWYPEKTTDIEELKRRSADADVLMIANNPLPDAVIDNAPNLKMISVAFVGIDHIGQAAAKKKDILISNAAGYCTETVAELALGLTVDVLRRVTAGDAAVRSGGTIAGLIGREINGKTVGIVGTGRIGIRTAEIFKAFNCKLLCYSRSQSEAARTMGMESIGLNELLEQSDIVSLHVPLTAETKGLINKECLQRMKSSAILINTSRGAVVDNHALAEALNHGSIAGAGIDVFDMEPPIPSDYPLLGAKNTVLTPHVAYASEESILRRAHMTFENVYAWQNGAPENIVKY